MASEWEEVCEMFGQDLGDPNATDNILNMMDSVEHRGIEESFQNPMETRYLELGNFPNQQITALRKQGRLQEAYDLAHYHLAKNPNDQYIRAGLAWVLYAYVKINTDRVKNTKNPATLNLNEIYSTIDGLLHEYSGLGISLPDMVHSNIIRLLLELKSAQGFGKLVQFYEQAGVNAFGVDDMKPYSSERGTSPSLLTKVARQVCKIFLANKEFTENSELFVFSLFEKALNNSWEQDKTWLLYDKVQLLNSLGRVEEAVKTMLPIVKKKRGEFWAWGMLGRILSDSNPEMAIACFCQGAMHCNDEKFAVKLHLELGLLLQREGFKQEAVTEILKVVQIRDQQGWPFNDELQGIMGSHWFDTSLALEDLQPFYAKRATLAMDLLVQDLPETPACYMRDIPLKSGKGSLAIFALKKNGVSVQVAEKISRLTSKPLKKGKAYLLRVDHSGERTDIMSIRESDNDVLDSFDFTVGVVDHVNTNKKCCNIAVSALQNCLLRYEQHPESRNYNVGDFIRVWYSKNTRRDILDAYRVEKTDELPERVGFKEVSGLLNVHERGHGFVENTFVHPNLVNPEWQGLDVKVYAISGQKGLKAIKIQRL